MIFLKICLAYGLLWVFWWIVIPVCRVIAIEAKYDMELVSSMTTGNFGYKMKHNEKEINVLTDYSVHNRSGKVGIKNTFYDFYDFLKYSVRKTIEYVDLDPSVSFVNVYYNHYLKEEKESV